MEQTASKEITRLVILARRFPFNRGEVAAESYLETEIDYLASYFDEVIAVGTEAPRDDQPTCTLPGNVTALSLGCGNTMLDKGRMAIEGMLYPFGTPFEVKAALESDPVKGLGKKVFRGYFEARAKRKFDALCRELDAIDFSPTHVYSFWLYDTALVASWLSKKYLCVRTVARAHRYDLYANRNRAQYLPFRRYLLESLDKVLPCSKDGKSYIDSNWPGFEGKVSTLYLGTRSLPDKSYERFERRLSLVSCSRVVDVKRVSLIARAVSLLDARGMAVDWVHYGDGPLVDEAREICSNLERSTARFAGNLPNSNLLEEYEARHFDLFVNASYSEGLPLSIMEACGFGIPVLATDVGGTHEIVEDGKNGFLLSRECGAEGIAKAIECFDALSDIEKISMRREARAVWERGFQTKKNVEMLASVLGVVAKGSDD